MGRRLPDNQPASDDHTVHRRDVLGLPLGSYKRLALLRDQRGADCGDLASPAQATSPGLRPFLAGSLKSEIFEVLGKLETEAFYAIFVDAYGNHLGAQTLNVGSHRTVAVRCRDLFGRALALDAAALILAHNHPSGDVRPSAADRDVTRELLSIAGRLEVTLIDHLIVAGHQIYSMERGTLL